MRNEIYTKLTAATTQVNQQLLEGKDSLTHILGNHMGRIVSHAQASVNRGLLAEAFYLASAGEHDPHEVIADRWAQMANVIGEANTSKNVLASFFGRTFIGQEQASVIALPIGENQTFTAFNDMETLETALGSEPELVQQLINQGRNRLSIGALVAAAQHVTPQQLEQYKAFLAKMAQYRKNDDWIVRVGGKKTVYNVFGYKGIEAIRAAQQGETPKASELAQALGGIVGWMIGEALNHKNVVDTIPTHSDTGYISGFWVKGRVDYNPDYDYYFAEEPVEIRHPHHDMRETNGNNKLMSVNHELEIAHAEWKEVAGWLATARQIHNAAKQGVRPLTYRLRSKEDTESVMDVIAQERGLIAAYTEKKDAEFAAKRAGGEIKANRDAEEGWSAAIDGVLNASQKAQMNKLRKDMGFKTNGRQLK